MSFIGRTFTEPNPPERVVLDSVSNLCTAVRRSVGLVCNCLFSVSVHRDVLCIVLVTVVNIVLYLVNMAKCRSDFSDVVIIRTLTKNLQTLHLDIVFIVGHRIHNHLLSSKSQLITVL